MLKAEASWPNNAGQNTRSAASHVWGMWQSYLKLSEHLLFCEATSSSRAPALSPHLPLKKDKTMQTDGDTPRQAMGICLMTPDSAESSLNPHVMVNIYIDVV